MHKKHLIMALFAVVAAVAGYGVYQTQANEVALSEVGLANVEALAKDEIVRPNPIPCTPDTKNICMYMIMKWSDTENAYIPDYEIITNSRRTR